MEAEEVGMNGTALATFLAELGSERRAPWRMLEWPQKRSNLEDRRDGQRN